MTKIDKLLFKAIVSLFGGLFMLPIVAMVGLCLVGIAFALTGSDMTIGRDIPAEIQALGRSLRAAAAGLGSALNFLRVGLPGS